MKVLVFRLGRYPGALVSDRTRYKTDNFMFLGWRRLSYMCAVSAEP